MSQSDRIEAIKDQCLKHLEQVQNLLNQAIDEQWGSDCISNYAHTLNELMAFHNQTVSKVLEPDD